MDRNGDVELGQITKEFKLTKEVFTDADNFRCTFPLDLDVKTKAGVLGAALLIVSARCSATNRKYTSLRY